MVGTAGAVPGTVLALGPEGLVVACGDGGAVRCTRARDGGTKAAAAEVAQTIGLPPGSRLGPA